MDKLKYQRIFSERSIRRHAVAETDELLQDLCFPPDLISHADNDLHIPSDLSPQTDNDLPTPTEIIHENIAIDNDNPLDSDNDDMQSEDEYFSTDESDSIYGDANDTCSLDSAECEGEHFVEQLKEWALRSNTPHVHINSLLTILDPYFEGLPKDARTLLKTKTNYDINDVAGGSYHHFGIQESIITKLNHYPYLRQQQNISIQVNIDGLPLFKSSNDCFWPILGLIIQENQPEPFIIGLWSGKSKPKDANLYLEKFVNEIKQISENGITYNDSVYSVTIENFICDTPARAFIKVTKGHNGYHGCDYCTQPGQHFKNRVTFPETDAPIRTNDSFKNMSREGHHRGESILKNLDIGMVTQFPLDFMHLICLGIMKKMINLWLSGPLNVRLGSNLANNISDFIMSLRSFLPREFVRKGRKLNEVDRWKATELRTFLLYTGPVTLKGRVSDLVYNNFMMLSAGVYILCSLGISQRHIDYVEELFVAFVKQFGDVYGRETLIYNVHALIHLPGHTRLYGSLFNFSCFPFENFLQTLKKMVRKPAFPLQQIIRRLHEKNKLKPNEKSFQTMCKKMHDHGPLPGNTTTEQQFDQLHMQNFLLSTKTPDNAILVDSDTYVIKNIIVLDNVPHCVCIKFRKQKSFFNYPFESSEIKIFLVSDLTEHLCLINIDDIDNKVVLLPYRDSYVSIPML